MAKDIRNLFEAENKLSVEKMPKGHEARFLNKLEATTPKQKNNKKTWLNIAASVVLLIGLGFGSYHFINPKNQGDIVTTQTNTTIKTKSLGDISPDLKKIEDYYLANINLELSKVKLTPENKELFDGYVKRLDELKKEYQNLTIELTKQGPDEFTVNALINNLKLRLNLMYRLKNQLQDLKTITNRA